MSAPSTAVFAFGTQVQKQDPVSLVWATISMMESITGPDIASDEVDVTTHDSPGQAHEWLPTLTNFGLVTGMINYNPADPTQDENTGILADLLTKARQQFRIVLPDTGHKTITFPGYVRDFKMTESVKDVLKANLSIRIRSAPTFSGS